MDMRCNSTNPVANIWSMVGRVIVPGYWGSGRADRNTSLRVGFCCCRVVVVLTPALGEISLYSILDGSDFPTECFWPRRLPSRYQNFWAVIANKLVWFTDHIPTILHLSFFSLVLHVVPHHPEDFSGLHCCLEKCPADCQGRLGCHWGPRLRLQVLYGHR